MRSSKVATRTRAQWTPHVILTQEEIDNLDNMVSYHTYTVFKKFGRYTSPWIQYIPDCKQQVWYEIMYMLANPKYDRSKGTPMQWCSHWIPSWVRQWMCREGWLPWHKDKAQHFTTCQLAGAFVKSMKTGRRRMVMAILPSPAEPQGRPCANPSCDNKLPVGANLKQEYCTKNCNWTARKNAKKEKLLVLAQNA
jgi:hypothetical protein